MYCAAGAGSRKSVGPQLSVPGRIYSIEEDVAEVRAMPMATRVRLLLAGMLLAGALCPMPAHAESYTMREGDTLWEIARVKYGDPSFYSDLQKVNSISNPRAIPNGTVINLPSKQTLARLRGVTDPAEREKILKGEGGTPAPGSSRPPRAAPQTFNPLSALGSTAEPPRVGGSR